MPNVLQSPIALSTKEEISKVFPYQSPQYNRKVKHFKYDAQDKVWNVLDRILLLVNNNLFRLHEFHVHQKGEHTLNGKHFPIELHCVFQDKDERILVLGFLAKQSSFSSSFFRDLLDSSSSKLKLPELNGNTFYNYIGSLTGPPFPSTSNVNWFVSAQTLKITREDLEKLKSRSKNSRPLQPRNGRPISYFQTKSCSQ